MFTKSCTLKNAQKCRGFLSQLVRKKSFNSAEWLKRREADIYVEKAKVQNFRCRSAFKLIEIDDRYQILKPGFKVLDVGAAPGSWSEVVADRINSNKKDPKKKVGTAIAVDLQVIHPIEGVHILSQSDFTKAETHSKILEILGKSKKLDCVLSDMAPLATGIKSLDQEKIIELIYPVVTFAVKNLKPGGTCLIKLWSGNFDKLKGEMKRFFKYLSIVKPKASYDSSAELYLLGREFVGLNK